MNFKEQQAILAGIKEASEKTPGKAKGSVLVGKIGDYSYGYRSQEIKGSKVQYPYIEDSDGKEQGDPGEILKLSGWKDTNFVYFPTDASAAAEKFLKKGKLK